MIARDERPASNDAERQRITQLVLERTGHPPRELRLLHTAGGLVVFVSVIVGPDSPLADARELASRLEDDIRDGQPHMADVVVDTEPGTPPQPDRRRKTSAGAPECSRARPIHGRAARVDSSQCNSFSVLSPSST